MQICLLTCAAPFLIDEKVFPPLGLLAVGTALRAQGHTVVVRGTPNDYEYFALGPTTPEYPYALELLQKIKAQNEKSRVVIGGHHAEANPEECLADGFDTIALGDGENVTAATFETSGVVNLGRRMLSQYPIADRSLINIHSYQYTIEGIPATTIMTSRGCPYKCGFCAKTDRGVRCYSVDRIEKEVAYLKKDCGYEALMLFDDVFILNKQRALAICHILKKHGITWRCFVRGDLVIRHGPDLVDIMARSGCVEVGIGIESASDKILRIIGKGEDIGTIREAIHWLQQRGIRVKGFFVVGLPGEDYHTIKQTRRFLRNTLLDGADFTIYQPYKGSPIWENRQNYQISWKDLPNDKRFYKGRNGEYRCIVSTPILNSAEIEQARDELERFFKNR